jgi:PKD repeat protein
MKSRYAFLLFLVGLTLPLQAQNELKHCGSDETNLQLLLEHPVMLNNWIRKYTEQETWIEDYTASNQQRSGDTVFKIPVVVHVIHFDGPENISDAQIYNGIDILTRNYRKLNPDTIAIVPFFQPIAADMAIEFELARLDPQGQCTNGINRIRSALTNTGGHNVKELIHWPREKYLNIYIVKNAAGLAGHALMPFQADSIPGWDGIVIGGDYFGNIGTSNDLKSVVLSHEAGHYLNLYHIWGGNNVPGFYYLPCADTGNCAYDDGVFDTPNTIGWQTCNVNGNTCDSVLDNVQNFMDYAYCAKMFTLGQKARARACLHSSISNRNNLWTTANLTATGLSGSLPLCQAHFTTPRQIYCAGNNIQFTDASYHEATQWSWDFGDGNISTLQNPQHAYSNPGLYTVSLTASNGISTVTTVKTGYMYVLEDVASFALPYTEGFEWVDSLTQTRMVGFTETNTPWEIVQGIYASGNQSIRAHCENDTLQYKYTLVSPVLDFSTMVLPHIDFKYAFAQKDSSNIDQMNVKISKNCGLSWANLNTQTSTLPTHSGYVNGNYIPDPTDWRQMSITNIGGAYITNTVIFKIEFMSGGGNDFYLDDINIYDAASIGIEENTQQFVQIHPNPATQYFEITGDFENAQIEIMDLNGKILMCKNIVQGEKIPTETWSNGLYMLRIKNENKISCKKIVIHH